MGAIQSFFFFFSFFGICWASGTTVNMGVGSGKLSPFHSGRSNGRDRASVTRRRDVFPPPANLATRVLVQRALCCSIPSDSLVCPDFMKSLSMNSLSSASSKENELFGAVTVKVRCPHPVSAASAALGNLLETQTLSTLPPPSPDLEHQEL